MVPERLFQSNGMHVSDEEWAEIQARLAPTEAEIDEWCQRRHPTKWWQFPAVWGGVVLLTILVCWAIYKLVRLDLMSLVSDLMASHGQLLHSGGSAL